MGKVNDGEILLFEREVGASNLPWSTSIISYSEWVMRGKRNWISFGSL